MAVRAVEHALDQNALDRIAHREHRQRHQDQQQPERDAEPAQRERAERPEGVELAMGHVDDVEQAENDGQPDRHQNDGDAEGEAGDDLRCQHELDVVEHLGHHRGSPPLVWRI